MAFPSLTGTVPLTLEAAWEQARATATAIKSQCSNLIAQCQTGNVPGNVLVGIAPYFAGCNAALTTVAAVGGLAAYAQAQINNASENIVSDFSTMQAALVATIGWIISNFPADTNGNLLYTQFNADGTLKYTVFSAAQLTGLVTQLQALAATIN